MHSSCQSVHSPLLCLAMMSSPSVSWLQPPPSSAWLVSLAPAAAPVQSLQPMVRHSAGVAAARLRKTSDQSTPPQSTNISPSHAGRAIAPSAANGSAAVTAAAAQQANRLRANSLSQTIQQRRRKRDSQTHNEAVENEARILKLSRCSTVLTLFASLWALSQWPAICGVA